jgi:hypothetical protein
MRWFVLLHIRQRRKKTLQREVSWVGAVERVEIQDLMSYVND